MNIKRRMLYLTIWVVICSVVGIVAAYFFNVGFWLAFLITAAALLLNGVVAEIEDRRPGGFLNPRKKD